MANIEIKFGNKWHWDLSPALFCMAILYLLFPILDMQSSRQTGNRGADRSHAHLALLAFTGYMGAYALIHIKKIKISRTLIPLILLAVWIFFTGLINHAETWDMLVQMNMSVLWILCYLFFYDYTKNGKIEKNNVYVFSVTILLFYCIATIYYSFYAFRSYGHYTAMNIIYFALAILPWVFVEEKRVKLFFIVVFLTTFISLKRGALIALPIMYVVRTLLDKPNRKEAIKKIVGLIDLFIGLCIAFYIVNILTDGFIAERFSIDELSTGSGRSDLYLSVIGAIKDRDFVELMLGSGIGSSVDLLGTGVHNEWLEMLFSYGIIGLAIYTSYIVGIITTAKRIYRMNTQLGSAAAMSVALYLILSFVSTGYGGYSGVFLFGFWGYIESLSEEDACER